MTYDSIDLSTYNLTVRRISHVPFIPSIESSRVPVANKAYDFRAELGPKTIRLDCIVTGTSISNLVTNLDAISKLLNPQNGSKQLILDVPDARYYNAKLDSMLDWEIVGDKVARGELTFVCADPLGYSTTPTSNNHTIDADPKTVTETTLGGTAYIEPIYTLTAGENLTDVTIKIKNNSTGEEIEWIGSINTGQTLVINVPLWIVYKAGTADMSTVSGQFPRLLPSYANSITVTGFSTTGSLNIAYRNTYL